MLTRSKTISASIGIVVIIGALVSLAYIWGNSNGQRQGINTFEECADAGYPIRDSYPEQCSIPNGPNFIKEAEQPGPARSFEGTAVCLPHRDTSGPQTLECAVGLLADDGTHYQLRIDQPVGELAMSAGSKKQFRITGTLEKIPSEQYQSEGIITVVDFQAL